MRLALFWDRESGGGLWAAAAGAWHVSWGELTASAIRRDLPHTSYLNNYSIDRKQEGDATRVLRESPGCWTRGAVAAVVAMGGGGGVEVSRGGTIVLTQAYDRSWGQLQPARGVGWHRDGLGGTPTHVRMAHDACGWVGAHARRAALVGGDSRAAASTGVIGLPTYSRVTSNMCEVPLAGAGERCCRLGRACEEVAIGGRSSEPRHHAGASPTPQTCAGSMANPGYTIPRRGNDDHSESFRLLSELQDILATSTAYFCPCRMCNGSYPSDCS